MKKKSIKGNTKTYLQNVHNKNILLSRKLLTNKYGLCSNFKGYLCYKTITPQSVLSGTHVNFFFVKRYVPFSRYSSFCIFSHPMIYQICDVMMSISTWDILLAFLNYLLKDNSLSHQFWPIDWYKQVQYLLNNLEEVTLSSRPFSIQQPAPITL